MHKSLISETIMKLFRFEFEKPGWDDYDGFVVLANSIERAKEMVHLTLVSNDQFLKDFTVEEIKLNKEDIILTSFHAG